MSNGHAVLMLLFLAVAPDERGPSRELRLTIEQIREDQREHERMLFEPHGEVWTRPTPADGGWNYIERMHGHLDTLDAGRADRVYWRCRK